VALPSGTTLRVRSGPEGDDIVLESAGGAMEVRIRVTADGPVLSLRGVRLEIEAADSVALNCREFSIEARDGIRLASGGPVRVDSDAEIKLRSADQTFIDGDYVNLNCLDRTGYHDDPSRIAPAEPADPNAGPGDPA
jgi:hypothetical protein